MINDHTLCDELRTRDGYDDQITEIENDESLKPVYGLKKRCVLNELKYFHIVDGSPGDLAHNHFKGFGLDDLCQA